MEAISAPAIEVEDLDNVGLLAAASEAERLDRMVQHRKLRVAYEWCVRHPATPETGTATWGDAGLPGLTDCDASLGGDGSPAVAAFAAEELGAAMGVSTQSAMSLMADALDMRHRIPQLWANVESGVVAPWKSRRVAADTRSLPFEGARWVDEQLAARVDGFGLPTIERLVALATARFAPEEQAAKEQAAGSGHHVTLSHPAPGQYAGTSWLDASGDTADLTAFHRLVCDVAKQLGRQGNTDDYETRKAKALGVIAARHGGLDQDNRDLPRRPVQTHLYVHVSLADLATLSAGSPTVGEVEKLGPATLDLIKSWLDDSKVKIQPVLDLDRTDAVDQHDPPPWMRELVVLRDRHCVFPVVRPRRPGLRPGPHHRLRPARRGRATGPDEPAESRATLSATSPGQDLHRLDLRTRPRRHLRVDQPPRPHLDRRSRRHHPRARTRPSRGVHPRHLTLRTVVRGRSSERQAGRLVEREVMGYERPDVRVAGRPTRNRGSRRPSQQTSRGGQFSRSHGE